MQQLPIHEVLGEVGKVLSTSHLVLEAPPGAGKSTALPLWLLEQWLLKQNLEQSEKIFLIQPRRVAAVNLAHYLAHCLNEPIGQRVGYQIRGERHISKNTRIILMTEGVFTQIIQADPALEGIKLVIFDEFHERNLHSDLGLALCVDSLALNPERRILIMSATIPGAVIQAWLQAQALNCGLVLCQGRAYPLTFHERPPSTWRTISGVQPNWLQAMPNIVLEAMNYAKKGVLVFLPGIREIKRLASQLTGKISPERLFVLHGGLSIYEQQNVLHPRAGEIRVVLSTNLAETSLTIPDIDVVVDSGRERYAFYEPTYRMTQLKTKMISRASAVQRAGRAGRTQAGHCFRLWNAATEERLEAYNKPAIEREDLSRFLLEIKVWGTAPAELAWLSAPAAALLNLAEQTLETFGVLEQGLLTAKGRYFAEVPTDIRYSALFYEAWIIARKQPKQADIQWLAAWVVAHLESGEVRLTGDLEQGLKKRWQDFKNRKGLEAFRRTKQRFEHWLHDFGLTEADCGAWPDGLLGPLLLAGFSDRVAQVQAHRVQLATGLAVNRPADLTNQDWLVAVDVQVIEDAMLGTQMGHLHAYVPLLKDSLLQGTSALKQQKTFARWRGGEQASSGLERVSQQVWGRLVLLEVPAKGGVTVDERAQAMADWLIQQGWSKTAWGNKEEQLCERIRLGVKYLEKGFAKQPIDALNWVPSSLLTTIKSWALPWLSGFERRDELLKWQPYEALSYLLGQEAQRMIDKELPVHWQAPSGRKHKIQYASHGAVVALKVQEVFGTPKTPLLAQGRLALTFDLLAPNGRLLNRTADLASFWQTAWPEVRKEMRGRYPKHLWPESPQTTEATYLTKRALARKHTSHDK